MRLVSGFAAASLSMIVLAACGSKPPPPAPPPKVVAKKPPPPPPPPPICVKAGTEIAAIGSPSADAAFANFCVSDAEAPECFTMDLATGKLEKTGSPSPAQHGALGEAHARVETTATEVKVCVGEACKTFKPSVPKGAENPVEAVANADGTLAVVLSGDGEKGKGVAEIWDATKGKKVINVKYAKGDYKCGHARVLGATVFVSADVCAGPAARGTLFSAKGKKLADVGGKDFGTYGTEPVQLTATEWAFLEETGATIAIQDVKTGKVVKTIDLGAVWSAGSADKGEPAAPADEKAAEAKEEAAPASAPALGNPGESAMVRGGDGKLVVITGGPNPGHVAIVDTASGEVQVVHPLGCK